MVARIRTGKNMTGALNYNERKVREGKAECIAENMFGAEPERLTFAAKLKRFTDHMQLNRRSKTNVVHISLNFAVGEKLGNDKLRAIADSYMDRLGFGSQPYLVYNHFDAGHPHIHILTTSIKENGKRIPLHNLARLRSEAARVEIEKMFGLEQASGKKKVHEQFTDIGRVTAGVYGKSETKEVISKIVRAVTRSYKYSSLPELNAVLKQFNVVADRGAEGTIMHGKKGLVYQMLDGSGNKVGIPIKASSIYGKPTLANLEKQFVLNEVLRKPFKVGIQTSIQQAFANNSTITVEAFLNKLKSRSIDVVFRKNETGRVYGITFVDNRNRVVFNGSDLGKEYSANAIMSRLTGEVSTKPQEKARDQVAGSWETSQPSADSTLKDVISELMKPENSYPGVDPSLIRRKRRKRKGKSL